MTKNKEWFEKDEFWVEYAPVMFDAQRWAEAPKIAESICSIAGLSNKSTILDAGCGPGRISIELAMRGLKVTAVDLIKPMLDAAQQTANDEHVKINFIQDDLRIFTSKKKFDAAVNLYTSFGYCESIEDDIKILQRIFAALKKDGWFIMETLGREIAVRDFTEGEWFERAGKIVLTEFSVVGAWEGLRSKWTLIDSLGTRTEHEFTQRLYSGIELKRILSVIGFSTVEIYGDFDFSPYNQKARTLVIVARK